MIQSWYTFSENLTQSVKIRTIKLFSCAPKWFSLREKAGKSKFSAFFIWPSFEASAIARELDWMFDDFNGFLERIDNWQKNLKGYNNVQNTMAGTNVINNLKRRADFWWSVFSEKHIIFLHILCLQVYHFVLHLTQFDWKSKNFLSHCIVLKGLVEFKIHFF